MSNDEQKNYELRGLNHYVFFTVKNDGYTDIDVLALNLHEQLGYAIIIDKAANQIEFHWSAEHAVKQPGETLQIIEGFGQRFCVATLIKITSIRDDQSRERKIIPGSDLLEVGIIGVGKPVKDMRAPNG